MTTLTDKDRELVLWALDRNGLLLEDPSGEGVHAPCLVKLTFGQVRMLAALVEDQMSNIEEDISRCISDSSSSVLDRYHCALGLILDSLKSETLAEVPGDCLHPA